MVKLTDHQRGSWQFERKRSRFMMRWWTDGNDGKILSLSCTKDGFSSYFWWYFLVCWQTNGHWWMVTLSSTKERRLGGTGKEAWRKKVQRQLVSDNLMVGINWGQGRSVRGDGSGRWSLLMVVWVVIIIRSGSCVSQRNRRSCNGRSSWLPWILWRFKVRNWKGSQGKLL